MAAEEEDLVALGLVANSYDALFQVRKRIRKINDITLPVRAGLATNQIGVGILVFIIAVITYGFIGLPIMGLLGIDPGWQILVLWLLVPPVLAGQRIAKPMQYGKSIGGTITSWMRFHLDDPVHRRGVPIPTPKQPADIPVLHHQREWVMAEDLAGYVPGEGDYSDADTERRMSKVPPIELQGWYDQKAIEHIKGERSDSDKKDKDNMSQVSFRRGGTATVLIPEDKE